MGFNPVDLAFGNMDALRSSNERLRAENAKLREALQDAYDDLCGMYVYVDDAYCFEDLHEDPLFGPTVRRLEEVLGIEVDA